MNTRVKIVEKKEKFFYIFVVFLALLVLLVFLYKNIFKYSMFVGDSFFGGKYYNLEIAEKAYLLASKTNPPFPYSNYQLGRINFIKGNFYTAIDYFNKEEEQYPQNSKVYYMRGLTYGYMGSEGVGILEFEKYVKLNPYSWAGRNDMAWLQFRVGDIKGAIETILPATLFTADNPWVFNSYGVFLLNDGKYKEALESFEKANGAVSLISEKGWGMSYPGNNPVVYGEGLGQMINSIKTNILLTKEKIKENEEVVDKNLKI